MSKTNSPYILESVLEREPGSGSITYTCLIFCHFSEGLSRAAPPSVICLFLPSRSLPTGAWGASLGASPSGGAELRIPDSDMRGPKAFLSGLWSEDTRSHPTVVLASGHLRLSIFFLSKRPFCRYLGPRLGVRTRGPGPTLVPARDIDFERPGAKTTCIEASVEL